MRTAREVDDLSCYSAVVLGSGVYAGRWLREAVRFARRHRDPLRRVPVWLFSSGPLDPSAREGDLPAVPGAVKVGDLVDAREHRTFGGRLVPGARGFMARMILRQGRAVTTGTVSGSRPVRAASRGRRCRRRGGSEARVPYEERVRRAWRPYDERGVRTRRQ